jgi:hypothetical protein
LVFAPLQPQAATRASIVTPPGEASGVTTKETVMKRLMIIVLAMAGLMAAQNAWAIGDTAKGAVAGAVAGAVVAGPVGAVVGAGGGAVAGHEYGRHHRVHYRRHHHVHH